MRPLDFEAIYQNYFDFVWRSCRRLGVCESSLDDVTQEVFLIVHRKLDGFERRSQLKTWIYGVARRVVSDHRRHEQRRGGSSKRSRVEAERSTDCPHENVSRDQAAELLRALLDELREERREVFVLAELEEMSAPEIAEATGTKLNTVYSRLRAARTDFERALSRHRAREERRRA